MRTGSWRWAESSLSEPPSPFPLRPSHPRSIMKGTCQQHCLIGIDTRDDLYVCMLLVIPAICVFPVPMNICWKCDVFRYPAMGRRTWSTSEPGGTVFISWEGMGNEIQVSSALALRESLSSGWGNVFTDTMWKLSIFILWTKKLTLM